MIDYDMGKFTRIILESSGPVCAYKLRYIVGFWLVEMAISTNQNPTIYRNLYENTAPGGQRGIDQCSVQWYVSSYSLLYAADAFSD